MLKKYKQYRQAGFTLTELITVIFFLGCFAGVIALICVAVHFICKHW